MVLYPNKLPESERVCFGICTIAHGRELASVIGGRYTISEIECIYNDINTYCSYIITVFEDYITNEMYLIGH